MTANLPLHASEFRATQAGLEAGDSGAMRPDLRVFLVEDSSEVREIVSDVLSSIPGVKIVGYAEDESSAYNMIVAGAYDVLIFDLELKQGNGISLLRSLAKLERPVQSIKIIFSNNSTAAYRHAGTQFGVQHFFDKMTQFDDLRDCLAKLSEGRGLIS